MKDPHKNKRNKHREKVEKPNTRRDRSKSVRTRFNNTVMDILFQNKLQDIDFEKLLKQGVIKEITNDTTGVAEMTKVYIGASYPRRKEAQMLALKLSPIMEIVSTWHRDDLKSVPRDGEECQQRVIRDIPQIGEAQLVVIFIGDELSGGGRHTELGIAIGMKKDIILIGDFNSNPFELLPSIRVYESVDNLVEEMFSSQDNMRTYFDSLKSNH